MGKIGLCACINATLKLMGLNCSEDTLNRAENLLVSFPTETQDALAESVWKRMDRPNLTEKEALEIISEYEQR